MRAAVDGTPGSGAIIGGVIRGRAVANADRRRHTYDSASWSSPWMTSQHRTAQWDSVQADADAAAEVRPDTSFEHVVGSFSDGRLDEDRRSRAARS
jgi:hypothetical protein